FTITPGNYKLIEQVAKEMEQLQIDTFRIGHLNFLSQSDFDAHMRITGQLFGIERDVSWAGFISGESGIDAQYIADALERIKNMQNKNFKVTVFPKFSRDEIIRYYSKGSFQSDSFKNACLAPWDIGVIGPQGELVTCPNYVVGNLRNHSFSDLWNNDRARKFRKIIKEKKHLPACSRGCCFYYI
ncbi:SPASM domain-containing protein, partial [bacterium]|nr:SPASM domain-containing protein [bacterium]